MAIVLNGTTGITAPDIDVTAQSTDIVTTGDISAVDATLSGGVYLGGTGAANYLDDYEEGTWTPTFYDSGVGDPTTGYDYQEAYFCKVGRIVKIWGICRSQGTTGSYGGALIIKGLPFAINAPTGFNADIDGRASASGGSGAVIENSSYYPDIFRPAQGTTQASLRYLASGTHHLNCATNQVLRPSADTEISFFATYYTNS